MHTVSVKGKEIRINGLQFGPTYSSHENAIHQGKIIHEKHYPQAKFEITPELPSPIKIKNKKACKLN